MSTGGERCYAYAKACGIIGKSFVGTHRASLAGLTRLAELDRLVFPLAHRDLPEKELLVDFERRLLRRAVLSIAGIIACFSKPPEFFVRMLRAYEYTDLKAALDAIAAGHTARPDFVYLGRFCTVHFEAWPNVAAMLKGSEFEWILDSKHKELHGMALQTALDTDYYTKLWRALFKLPKNDRVAAQKLLTKEITLRNAVWALRLRTFYRLNKAAVKEHLIPIHSQAALESLDFALDNHSDWEKWRLSAFLNPHTQGEHWCVNPRFFQNSASEHLYRLAKRSFHQRPLSCDAVFCFIKLKQYEEDILTSLAEGFAFGMSGSDTLTFVDIKP
ncbi:V-type ATPase subunit [Breznakiellaceae bacterium SP9]